MKWLRACPPVFFGACLGVGRLVLVLQKEMDDSTFEMVWMHQGRIIEWHLFKLW